MPSNINSPKSLVTCLLFILLPSLAAAIPNTYQYFRPGFWGAPGGPGNGYDIHRAGNVITLAWYTFDANGAPI